MSKIKAVKRKRLILGFLFIFCLVISLRKVLPISSKRNLYRSIGGPKYSFAYPKSWVITECENGNLVVANRKVEKCYFPLDAPEEYLRDIYFQIFLPSSTYTIMEDSNLLIPDKLQGWKYFMWIEGDVIPVPYKSFETSLIPVAPRDTDLYVLWSEENRYNYYAKKSESRQLATPGKNIAIGFIDNPEFEWEYDQILESFHLHIFCTVKTLASVYF